MPPSSTTTTRWAWKAVSVALTSKHGLVWPVEGYVKASGPFETENQSPCPLEEGDGLCLAKTPMGAASGGYGMLSSVILLTSFNPGDVLGEDGNKIRVKKCRTHGVLDARKALIVPGATLTGANLTGATLYGADLTRANLTGATLYRADLTGATLTGANLTRANLTGANLYGADLTGATLYGADLTRAALYGATLTGANLTRANLTGANHD